MKATKLDLQKAYDRVNGKFLLLKLSQQFPHLFSSMVVSRSSSSQVEGLDKVILYPPTYSFLAKKFYQRLIDKEHSIGRLGGIKASMRVPAITHVMYTDDVMLFSKANLREAEILNECLETYCNWSGQQINKQKSRLIF